MFDFMFGGKRKLSLIRELLEQRMRDNGFNDMESRLKVKDLGKLQLIGTPEGGIVTIVETIFKSTKARVNTTQALKNIEQHRSGLGSSPSHFNEILKALKDENPGRVIPLYCAYRMAIEHPDLLSEDQIMDSVMKAVAEISNW